MRKISIVLSVMVLGSLILAACGGRAANTNVPNTNVPPATSAATETNVAGSETATEVSTATEVPTEGTATSTTETPGIPVTGQANADRLSKELDFKVLDQSGKQVGKVDDMVLDLSKAQVLYVIVNTGKKIPVPWALLKAETGSTSSTATGQQNAFILQADTDTLKNAPEFNLKNLPPMGESPDSWDIAIRKYWQGSSATSGNNTPSPVETPATNMTATATSPSNSTGTEQATGTGQGAISIQGVQLASKVLGAKLTVGLASLNLTTPSASAAGTSVATSTPSSGTSAATSTPGTGTGVATSTPGTATAVATSTASSGTSAATSAPSTGAKSLSATIDDLIVNRDSGNILDIVVKTNFDNGEHLIPVPLELLQWDADNQAFILNVEAATLQSAPSFTSDQFPDLTSPGWNSGFDTFWQGNGSGNGAQATATP